MAVLFQLNKRKELFGIQSKHLAHWNYTSHFNTWLRTNTTFLSPVQGEAGGTNIFGNNQLVSTCCLSVTPVWAAKALPHSIDGLSSNSGMGPKRIHLHPKYPGHQLLTSLWERFRGCNRWSLPIRIYFSFQAADLDRKTTMEPQRIKECFSQDGGGFQQRITFLKDQFFK